MQLADNLRMHKKQYVHTDGICSDCPLTDRLIDYKADKWKPVPAPLELYYSFHHSDE